MSRHPSAQRGLKWPNKAQGSLFIAGLLTLIACSDTEATAPHSGPVDLDEEIALGPSTDTLEAPHAMDSATGETLSGEVPETSDASEQFQAEVQEDAGEPDSKGPIPADATLSDAIHDGGEAEIADAVESADNTIAAETSLNSDSQPPLPDDTGAIEDTASDTLGLGDTQPLDVSELPADTASADSIEPVSDTLVVADAEVAPDAGPEEISPPPNLWLLSIDNSTKRLQKIDAATGKSTDICGYTSIYTYPSLTFSRDNGLYASRSGSGLDRIDPCTCEITPIGNYGGYSGVNGITSDFGLNLFGVAITQDVLIRISTSLGMGATVGDLGMNFGYTGATWSEQDELLYAIDATTDGLYTIDPMTGLATFVTGLDHPFGTVGIEMHPANGVIYACTDAAHLLSIDPNTGHVTDLGDMEQGSSCNNLAAPWLTVECLEEL